MAVFDFFNRPENLEKLTPTNLCFQILTPQSLVMHNGAVFDYLIHLSGLPMRWTSVITNYDPPFQFVDVQLKGPYAFWHHRHRFEQQKNGVEVTDEVYYDVGYSVFGKLFHGLVTKPPFAPPNSVFGPVWTVLYVLMGLCVAMVWRRGWQTPGVRPALLLFVTQLILNGIWSPLFFCAHAIGWALVDIILLWIVIGLTIRAFSCVSLLAARGLLPYWAWVTFATFLNTGYWWLNR